MSKELSLPRPARLSSLPYTTAPPARRAKKDREASSSGGGGIFGFIGRVLGFGGSKESEPKQAATTIARPDDSPGAPFSRDFLFPAPGGAVYFARQSRETAVFGFNHGQRLQHTKGVDKGRYTTVVGVRGGRLWTIDEDGEFALPLNGSNKAALEGEYGLEVMGVKQLAPVVAEASIPAEAINFLQTAPDLLLEIDGTLEPVCLPPTWVSKYETLGWTGSEVVTLSAGGVDGLKVSVVASSVINGSVPTPVATAAIASTPVEAPVEASAEETSVAE